MYTYRAECEHVMDGYILSLAVDDVVDKSDDNEDTEIDSENEEDEKDHKSQVTSSVCL